MEENIFKSGMEGLDKNGFSLFCKMQNIYCKICKIMVHYQQFKALMEESTLLC